jgi:SAM-dependent methyltransferase
MSVARYYAWLSRFQDAARLFAHDTGQHTFTVHRRLRGEAGEVSGDVLHERLLHALHATDNAATPSSLDVLDAGCGLGGTIFALHAQRAGRYVGITLSPTQCERATSEAGRRGIGGACRFAVRDYDTALDDLTPNGVDLVVAIESLAHSPDPSATVLRLAARLRPGGRLVLVDDVPGDTLPQDDSDLVGFRNGWLCPAVASDATLAAALAGARLTVCHDEDLTPRMPLRGTAALAGLVRLNRLGAALLGWTPAGILLGSLHGGLMLERLYRRDLVRYRLIVARKTTDAP